MKTEISELNRSREMQRMKTVHVTHRLAEGEFDFAGISVWSVKLALKHAFGIPYFAEAFVDGECVNATHCLNDGASLVFLKMFGSKRGDDSDEIAPVATGLVSAYRDLTEIGEQVKSLNLDPSQSIDELVRQVALFVEKRFGPYSKEEMLTIIEVARLLGCSYGEARNRMLDGRIRSVKDGRWHRTRRDWVEQYVEERTIHADPSLGQIRLNTNRRLKTIGVKPNGVALQFLREREE